MGVPGVDEKGNARGVASSVTAARNPLRSEVDISNAHDGFTWERGGALVPKAHPIAAGMRKAFSELADYYGDRDVLRLYREGSL